MVTVFLAYPYPYPINIVIIVSIVILQASRFNLRLACFNFDENFCWIQVKSCAFPLAT